MPTNTAPAHLDRPKSTPAVTGWRQALAGCIALCSRIPHSAIALLARLSIAAVFWQSGQTKTEGLVLNPVSGGW